MSAKKFFAIQQQMLVIDELLNNISNGKINKFFTPVSVIVQFNSAEAGFMRLISFIYILLHEDDSKVNFQFIADKIQSYKGSNSSYKSFKNLIHSVRTVLQHNVDVKKAADQEKVFIYEDWLNLSIGKSSNLKSKDWGICCDKIIDEFSIILKEIEETLKYIQNLERDIIELIVEDWISKLTHQYPIYKFRDIASSVAKNLGFPTLDDERFCQRHYGHWIVELSRQKDYDFTEYATRQIERDFLKDFQEFNLPIPIDATDIMDYLNLSPGKHIGELLSKAKVLYINTPCSKGDLLRLLKEL
jgi:hypothetical protein